MFRSVLWFYQWPRSYTTLGLARKDLDIDSEIFSVWCTAEYEVRLITRSNQISAFVAHLPNGIGAHVNPLGMPQYRLSTHYSILERFVLKKGTEILLRVSFFCHGRSKPLGRVTIPFCGSHAYWDALGSRYMHHHEWLGHIRVLKQQQGGGGYGCVPPFKTATAFGEL